MREFHYRVPWRAGGARPGHHPGSHGGSGLEFTAHAPLFSGADPRRLDVRASLRDPWGDWLVRVFRQRSSLAVYLVADVSASMGFGGTRRKLDVLADFAASAAYSARRTGDAFGFVACDERVREEMLLPATHARGAGAAVSAQLTRFVPDGRGAQALTEAAALVGRARSLVFLASDFHFPLELLERVLEGFAAHALVPLVLWSSAEYEALPAFGLGTLVDAESGRRRTLLLRRSLRQRWQAAFAQRREQLIERFRRHGVRPLFVVDDFEPDRVTEHFHGG